MYLTLKKRWGSYEIILSLSISCILLLSVGCRHEARVTDSQRAFPAVDHILLEVKDLDRLVKFYHDELGLKIRDRSGDFAMLEAANIGIYL